LQKLGYAVDQTTSQIIALHSGQRRFKTRALRDALEDRGIFGAVFAAPATPKNHAIIRLSVNARLRENDLDRVIDTLPHNRSRKEISRGQRGSSNRDRSPAKTTPTMKICATRRCRSPSPRFATSRVN